MNRLVRRVLLLGLAVAGVWAVRWVLTERARRNEEAPARPAELAGTARSLPAAPVLSDLDILRRGAREHQATADLRPIEEPVNDAPTLTPPAPVAPAPDPVAPAPEPVASDPVPTTTSAPATDRAPGPERSPARRVPTPGLPARTRVDTAHLDEVRQRLASINVDRPPGRATPPPAAGAAPTRARRSRRAERWQEPLGGGACHESHPIKVKLRSGLFHLPGTFAYERARADRCYGSAADAEADGFHRSKR